MLGAEGKPSGKASPPSPTLHAQTAQQPAPQPKGKQDKSNQPKKPRRPYEEIGAVFNGNEVPYM